ncbi:MBL fold metallo-hydrolase [Arenicella xantha]|uniref:Glyoxylase-like metal-dependent hydrolase (Beta-lactamase superfamily II) n=1 Tax=Arenicella xantha TaxID=644221 RepID=A0A395JM37_9GAMM|nr:MBL fold metallo-hydrolase [Arenicella xantha]RBP50674.1 glyoxylase-like metal-dependent hydrolase (beta-lactamase superfamily II) [Arenicella xantha]
MTNQKPVKPEVLPFFDEDSNTFSYIVKDPTSSACAIVDSVLDFDYPSGTVAYDGANKIIDCVNKKGLNVVYLLETHVHADHISAAPYIQSVLGGKIAIGKHIVDVQGVFGKTFNEGTEFERDGSQFDVLFDDDERYQIGALEGRAIHTPGHTPACMTHLIGDAAFVGDTLFMPDGGTARADFPGGDARILYRSIKKVLSLPDDTRLFMCHDYQPNGRELEYLTTVAEQKRSNIHVNDSISEDAFVTMRQTRDASLGMPRLILPSLQVNMRAGHFPEPEDNQTTYLKIPVAGLKKILIAHSQ